MAWKGVGKGKPPGFEVELFLIDMLDLPESIEISGVYHAPFLPDIRKR